MEKHANHTGCKIISQKDGKYKIEMPKEGTLIEVHAPDGNSTRMVVVEKLGDIVICDNIGIEAAAKAVIRNQAIIWVDITE